MRKEEKRNRYIFLAFYCLVTKLYVVKVIVKRIIFDLEGFTKKEVIIMKTGRPFGHYSEITRFLFRLMHPFMSIAMESQLRRKLNDPIKTLKGGGIRPGQKVLEVGCGTGYFTICAAKLVGDKGLIHAIDIYPPSVECVTRNVRDAHLTNVNVSNTDAMDTKLPDNSFDLILLFGVIPAPVLPLDRLLPEMHRLLKSNGTLAVWTAIPWWSRTCVTRSKMFTYTGRENGVYNFQKIS